MLMTNKLLTVNPHKKNRENNNKSPSITRTCSTLSGKPRKHIHGFTLIEILIVIVIISVISTVAMLSIHFNRNKQLETLANTLANLITLAEEEAMLRPAVLGLVFTPHSYQFYIYQENNHTWQPLPNRVFRATAIPDDTQITLKIHGQNIPTDGQHQLIISTSGDIPDFTISIGKSDQAPLYQVIGKESGDVHVK
jgi:general secretion pathway protein H